MLNEIYQNLDTVAFSLGPLVVRWYGLAYVLGFALAAFVIYRVAKRWRLGMTEDEWYNKSVGEQTQFINRLKSRLARYEEYDRDRANWESFGSPNAGDWVYRVPLSMLP